MKKSFIASLCLITLCVFTLSTGYCKTPIKIAVHDYAPYYNAKGEGLLIDLYNAACAAGDLEATYVVLPVKRAINELFTGKVDAFSPGAAFIHPGTEPYKLINNTEAFVIGVSFFNYTPNQEKLPILAPEDMAKYTGKKLACIVQSPFIPTYQKVGIKFEEAQNPVVMAKKTKAKYADFFECTTLGGLITVKGVFPSEWQNFDFSQWYRMVCTMAFVKDNEKSQALKKQFDKGLAAIIANGDYIRILETFWGKGNIPKFNLMDSLQEFGTDSFDLDKFQNAARDANGKMK